MDAVRNAADREQVKAAERTIKLRRQQDLDDLRSLLMLPPFRRWLWARIERLRPLDRLWDAGAIINYKAGFHDVAVMLINEVKEANRDAVVLMQAEALEREKADEALLHSSKKKTTDKAQAQANSDEATAD